MRLSREKIEEIIQNVNIVDIISKYVRLKKSGTNYKGLCPFHSEKTPSFMVSPSKQIYHCFGCHNGGNAAGFLMEYHKITFPEAIKELAAELGISIDPEDFKSYEKADEYEPLYDLTAKTAQFFMESLSKNPSSRIAVEYLQRRRISQGSVKSFMIGYSPGNNTLIDFYRKNNLDIETALELGILGKSEGGSLFERFAGRLIFPVFSPSGRVIAFGGRILEENKNVGKYVNSPENKIYIKGKNLYGLYHAKDEIRKSDKVIIVEGYLDLITLHQNGIRNSVAVSGTALTEDQVKYLSRFTKNVYLIFDADEAGLKAAMRSIEILLKAGINVRVVDLGGGEDPDSFINKRGAAPFLEKVENAVNFLEFQSAVYKRRGEFDDPVKMSEAIVKLAETIAHISDELKRNLFIKDLALKFSLRESILETAVDKKIAENEKFAARNTAPARVRSSPLPSAGMVKRDAAGRVVEKVTPAKIDPVFLNEKELIKLLLDANREMFEFVFHYIRPEDFYDENLRFIAELLYDGHYGGEIPSVDTIMTHLDEKGRILLSELVIDRYKFSRKFDEMLPNDPLKISVKAAIDVVKRFRILRIDQEIKNLRDDLKKDFDEERIHDISQSINRLMADKKELETELNELRSRVR